MSDASVCSGIEAATVAWEPLEWRPAWFSEIEKFPCAVLAHHYPEVPNLGDMTKILKGGRYVGPAVDVLVGGTPCQSFSIAGLRDGMADPRGNLALVFLGLVDAIRPRWVVHENVPGLLSSWTDEEVNPKTEGLGDIREEAQRLGGIIGPEFLKLGADFGSGPFEEVHQSSDYDTFAHALAELGYGVCGAILDAQYFGVPQRRERIFTIGYLGDWRPAAAVLSDRHSLSGNPPPSRTTGKRTTSSPEGIAGACSSKWAKGTGGPSGDETYNLVAHTLRAEHDASEDGTGRGVPIIVDRAAFNQGKNAQSGKGDAAPLVNHGCVRRLTPKECLRLQGFPDEYLDIIYKGKPAADGPKYKAIGNSMAVPCMRWIGERIQGVSDLLK